MRLINRLLIASIIGVAVMIGSVSRSSADGTILRARATINGAAGSGISGEVLFFQAKTGVPAEVLIIARVEGLPPNSVHGFHLHENGTCSPDFTAAGGHYDPGPFGMSNPDANHPFHMGDMPNLRANDKGVAIFEHVTSRVTIAPGRSACLTRTAVLSSSMLTKTRARLVCLEARAVPGLPAESSNRSLERRLNRR